MTKESGSRPGNGWPQSTENSCSPVSEKGENVVATSSGEIGDAIGATQSQISTDSPCTLNLGRGGEDSTNLGFN